MFSNETIEINETFVGGKLIAKIVSDTSIKQPRYANALPYQNK